MHGILVLDKPAGITSRDVVDHVQSWFPPKTKIGHTGTLDPRATGVLVVCIGSTTRLADYVQDLPKSYRTKFILGARSDTDDGDGVVTPTVDAKPLSELQVRDELARFTGEINQVPPAYSAALVSGQRAYMLARRGREVALAPRKVHIDRIDLLRYSWPELELDVHCGKGTYIRSIARDLGESLRTGAYVGELRRTRVGCFTPELAVPYDAGAAEAQARLLPAGKAVGDLPSVQLEAGPLHRMRLGQRVPCATSAKVGDEVAVFDLSGELSGIGKVTERGGIQPVIRLG
jgi:tRNA pseudouridine55 synthase